MRDGLTGLVERICEDGGNPGGRWRRRRKQVDPLLIYSAIV